MSPVFWSIVLRRLYCLSFLTRKAGIGIFILDQAYQSKFLIKAHINQITSVLMAEAASLPLAASIISLLHTQDTSFLTDSQLLVNFFNGNDLNSPPHWDIKPFTQRFLNAVTSRRVQVIKIARSSNITAHSSATQALRACTTHRRLAVCMMTSYYIQTAKHTACIVGCLFSCLLII